MQVEYDTSESAATIDFVASGQVFLYRGIPYIKTDKEGTAVDLRNGTEMEFDTLWLIEPVKAKVVIQHMEAM